MKRTRNALFFIGAFIVLLLSFLLASCASTYQAHLLDCVKSAKTREESAACRERVRLTERCGPYPDDCDGGKDNE